LTETEGQRRKQGMEVLHSHHARPLSTHVAPHEDGAQDDHASLSPSKRMTTRTSVRMGGNGDFSVVPEGGSVSPTSPAVRTVTTKSAGTGPDHSSRPQRPRRGVSSSDNSNGLSILVPGANGSGSGGNNKHSAGTRYGGGRRNSTQKNSSDESEPSSPSDRSGGGSGSGSNGGSSPSDSEEDDFRYKDVKPPYSYASLIAQAINSTKDKRLTLSSIYAWIMATYPFYTTKDNGWQVRRRRKKKKHKTIFLFFYLF